MIEKPFVLRIDHAEKLINLARKNKVKCWTSLQNRYNLALTKLKKELTKNSIGKVNLLTAQCYGIGTKNTIKIIGEENTQWMVVF